MLLAIDVGNTNTVARRVRGRDAARQLAPRDQQGRTADEYARRSCASCSARGARAWPAIDAAIVVDGGAAGAVRRRAAVPQRYLEVAPLVVGPGIKTGMPILYENPREVGADRIVNAVAAYERSAAGLHRRRLRHRHHLRRGTPKGEYLGGAIAPGHRHQRRRALPRRRQAAAGRDRAPAARWSAATPCTRMQAGLVFGYVGLVDGIVERMRAEIDFPARVVATGGLAPLIAQRVEDHRGGRRDADPDRACASSTTERYAARPDPARRTLPPTADKVAGASGAAAPMKLMAARGLAPLLKPLRHRRRALPAGARRRRASRRRRRRPPASCPRRCSRARWPTPPGRARARLLRPARRRQSRSSSRSLLLNKSTSDVTFQQTLATICAEGDLEHHRQNEEAPPPPSGDHRRALYMNPKNPHVDYVERAVELAVRNGVKVEGHPEPLRRRSRPSSNPGTGVHAGRSGARGRGVQRAAEVIDRIRPPS